MSLIEQRIKTITEEVVRATIAGEKSLLVDLHTAELLVEGFTELWLINQEDRERAEAKFRKAMDHKFERLAKKNEQCQKLANRNDLLIKENRALRAKVAKNERERMGGQE